MTSFEKWWSEEGSAMRPMATEDVEEFAKRIAMIAWSNGAYIFANQPEPVPGAFNPSNFDAIATIATPPAAQPEPEQERWQWIFEDKCGDRYTHKNLFYTEAEAAESAKICGVKAIRKTGESKVTAATPAAQPEQVTAEAIHAAWSAGFVEGEKSALAKIEQEPFGYFRADAFGWTDCAETDENAKALYEYPFESRQWVGLTEVERNDLEDYCEMIIGKTAFDAIEARLKERNT